MNVHHEEEKFETRFNGKTIVKILALSLKHAHLLAGFLLLVGGLSVLESFNTYVVKLIIDEGVLKADPAAILRNLSVFALVMCVQAATVFGFITCAGLLGEHLQYDLRKRMFERLQALSFSYFDKTPLGWIMARMTSDTGRIAELATWMLLDLFWGITNIISAVIFMVFINARLAMFVIAILPPLLIVALRFKKRIIVEFRRVRSINSRITGSYNENITGVRVVKALTREEENLKSFSLLTGEMHNHSIRAAWLSAMFLPVVQIVSSFALGAVIWYGGHQFRLGELSVGGIKAFVSYITFMLWPIQDLARVYAEMQHSIAGAERVFSLLETEPEIVDRPGALRAPLLRERIEFRNVFFHYDPDKPVLEDLSLSVRRGEMIALVGQTGGGKSTIVNLIGRFYEPCMGEILVDGVDYRAYTLESWQSKLGVVLQTPHLFSGTITENIRYGRLHASDEEVFEAARLAHADDFIAGLPGGYDAQVGEGGALLSVGQKQLISIARAILARPEIVVLDEATSSIDTITESLIQRGMDRLLSDCTSFVIAHRLSTIRHADRIIVIEGGRIREDGTHGRLLAARGHYYELYTRQFRAERGGELAALA